MRLYPSCFKKCARSAQPHNKTLFIAPLLLVPGFFPGAFSFVLDTGQRPSLAAVSVSLYHRGKIRLDKYRVLRTTYNGPSTHLLPFQGRLQEIKSFPHIVIYPRHFYFSILPILGGQWNARKAIAAARISLRFATPCNKHLFFLCYSCSV